MKNTENELIIKYLHNELSKEEMERLYLWLTENKTNQDFLFKLEAFYTVNQLNTSNKEAADTNKEWEKLESIISKLNVGKQTANKKNRRIPILKFLNYAAIFILAIAIPYTLFNNKHTHDSIVDETMATVSTGIGERSQLILPDGTKVWINSCSSLSYSSNLSSERKIKLSGEAYFEVSEDKNKPMTIETYLIDIKVLGTEFNLRAFEDDRSVETTLYEGSVSANTAEKAFKQDILLEPGQQMTYAEDKSLKIISINNKSDILWKKGVIHFKKQSLESISRRLEKNFNVNISILDSQLAMEEFTCEFESAENIRDILEILRMTGRMQYEINGSKIEINNYSKK
ncbi:anti-sigma factor [Bacteroidales bacterium]|nr:anti-sigma factor [Bacteroidales bacterium]